MPIFDKNCNKLTKGDKVNVDYNGSMYYNCTIENIKVPYYAYEPVVLEVSTPYLQGDKLLYVYPNEVEKIEKDKLEEIVESQKELFIKIINNRDIRWTETYENGDFDIEINNALKDHVLALNDEVAELQRELNWKWWANDKDLHKEKIDEELIDIIFFTLQALIITGNSAEDIYDLYMTKLQENHDRQDGNSDRKGYNPESNEKYENVDK